VSLSYYECMSVSETCLLSCAYKHRVRKLFRLFRMQQQI